MQPFRVHRGRVVPLLRRDIDTDQIIPKQFLKSVARTGFGQHLFHDWRHGADGGRVAFVLNDPRHAGGSILVAGANFGCGSSREHAAWALADYGFRAVVAPSFADIFRGNAIRNGLLPVAVDDAIVAALAAAAAGGDYTIEIDLEQRRLRDDGVLDVEFAIEDSARRRLLHGLDDIGLILQHAGSIADYERRAPARHRR